MDISSLGAVFRGTDAVAAGLVTPRQLRGTDVSRLFRDAYVDSRRPITHVLRCAAATLVLPGYAVITGRSAASVAGVPLAWPEDDVEVVVPRDMRVCRAAGVHVRRTDLEPGEWRAWGHGRIATDQRIGLDLLLARPVLESVPDIDAVLRAGLVDRDQLERELRKRSDNGVVVARQALALSDPRSGSVPESRLRVILVLDGLRPVPQYKIRLNGGVVAAADLAFPERRVAVEYDGDWRDGEQWALNRDRARLNQVQQAGWRVVFVTAPMLRDPRGTVALVRAALA